MHVDKAIATSLRIEIFSPIKTNFRDEAKKFEAKLSKKLSVIIIFTSILGDRLHLAVRGLICEARKSN